MPQQGVGGTGSILAGLVARRTQLNAVRQKLGLTPGSDRGVPQGGQKPVAPIPPGGPAQPRQRAGADQGQVPMIPEDKRQAMLERVRGFLGQISGGATGEAPPAIETVRPPTETQPLAGRLAAVGAVGLTANEQFYRLAGRPPSPRELAAFNARSILEGQLGRPPTSIELRMYLAREAPISPSFPRAFEG